MHKRLRSSPQASFASSAGYTQALHNTKPLEDRYYFNTHNAQMVTTAHSGGADEYTWTIARSGFLYTGIAFDMIQAPLTRNVVDSVNNTLFLSTRAEDNTSASMFIATIPDGVYTMAQLVTSLNVALSSAVRFDPTNKNSATQAFSTSVNLPASTHTFELSARSQLLVLKSIASTPQPITLHCRPSSGRFVDCTIMADPAAVANKYVVNARRKHNLVANTIVSLIFVDTVNSSRYSLTNHMLHAYDCTVDPNSTTFEFVDAGLAAAMPTSNLSNVTVTVVPLTHAQNIAPTLGFNQGKYRTRSATANDAIVYNQVRAGGYISADRTIVTQGPHGAYAGVTCTVAGVGAGGTTTTTTIASAVNEYEIDHASPTLTMPATNSSSVVPSVLVSVPESYVADAKSDLSKGIRKMLIKLRINGDLVRGVNFVVHGDNATPFSSDEWFAVIPMTTQQDSICTSVGVDTHALTSMRFGTPKDISTITIGFYTDSGESASFSGIGWDVMLRLVRSLH